MELPCYRLPTFKGLALHSWERLKGFILKAGKIIIPMVLVLNFHWHPRQGEGSKRISRFCYPCQIRRQRV